MRATRTSVSRPLSAASSRSADSTVRRTNAFISGSPNSLRTPADEAAAEADDTGDPE